MIQKTDRILNLLLSTIYFDKKDPSCLRISFTDVVKILNDFDMIVPQKMYEASVEAVLTERIVGKAPANTLAKHAVAEVLLNVAAQIAASPEEIKLYKIRNNIE